MQISIVLAVVWLGHQYSDVLADKLAELVAKQSLSGRVRHADAPVLADDENGVHCGIDDGLVQDAVHIGLGG